MPFPGFTHYWGGKSGKLPPNNPASPLPPQKGNLSQLQFKVNDSQKRRHSPLYWVPTTVLDCHYAGKPFQRMPLLISSTGPTASRSHRATTCTWLAGNPWSADNVKPSLHSKCIGIFVQGWIIQHKGLVYTTPCVVSAPKCSEHPP